MSHVSTKEISTELMKVYVSKQQMCHMYFSNNSKD